MKILHIIIVFCFLLSGCSNNAKDACSNIDKFSTIDNFQWRKFQFTSLHKEKFYCDYNKNEDLICKYDSVNFKTVHDDARFRTYCFRCRHILYITDSARREYKIVDTMTYGELSLKLFDYSDFRENLQNPNAPDFVQKDTGGHLLEFDFAYNDSPVRYLFENKNWYDHFSGRLHNFKGFALIYSIDNVRFPKLLFDGVSYMSVSMDNNEDILSLPLQPEVIDYIRTHQTKINPWFRAEAERRGVFDSVKYPPAKIAAQIARRKVMEAMNLKRYEKAQKRKASH